MPGDPKFRLTPAEQGELLADLLPFAQVVDLPRRLPVVPVCRDPHDTPFLHLAAARNASLVAGDRDLPVLAPEAEFPIVEIAAFLARLAPA